MKLRKGQVDANVTGFMVFAIVIVIGAIIFGEFDASAGNVSTSTAATAAIANISANTYSGINIVSIGPIVLAAVVILAIIGLLGARR